MFGAYTQLLVCSALTAPGIHPSADAFWLFLVYQSVALRIEKKQNTGLYEASDLMWWLCYYFLKLSSQFNTVMIFFFWEENTDWLWHIFHFFSKVSFRKILSPQFIQLQIYNGANSTIWYSLFFSPWSKSNHSKWLLMIIIATALYWSCRPMEWKQTERTQKQRGCSLYAIMFGLLIWLLWRRSSKILGKVLCFLKSKDLPDSVCQQHPPNYTEEENEKHFLLSLPGVFIRVNWWVYALLLHNSLKMQYVRWWVSFTLIRKTTGEQGSTVIFNVLQFVMHPSDHILCYYNS